jgi:DNA-directed RNA polymerase specialized sigma24 family protein
MDRFPATRHSIVERLRAADSDARRLAFGTVVDGYWKPVYTHLRLTWHLSVEDARDRTQGFFTEAFEKAWLERFDPGKARFRTFVRVCVDRYVMNAHQAEARLKRGGGHQVVSLDFAAAERELPADPAAANDPDACFHQAFIRGLFERTVDALRLELVSEGQESCFALFERYDLSHTDGMSYGQLASEFAMTSTQVTNRLARARRRFREIALDHLRELSGSDEEFRREARDLFGLDVA